MEEPRAKHPGGRPPKPKEEKMHTTIHVRVSDDMEVRLKEYADNHGITVAEAVREAVERFLKRHR